MLRIKEQLFLVHREDIRSGELNVQGVFSNFKDIVDFFEVSMNTETVHHYEELENEINRILGGEFVLIEPVKYYERG